MSAYEVIELENVGDVLIVMEQMDTDLAGVIESKNNISPMQHQLFIYQVIRFTFVFSKQNRLTNISTDLAGAKILAFR